MAIVVLLGLKSCTVSCQGIYQMIKLTNYSECQPIMGHTPGSRSPRVVSYHLIVRCFVLVFSRDRLALL
jgi:hypothetical protein